MWKIKEKYYFCIVNLLDQTCSLILFWEKGQTLSNMFLLPKELFNFLLNDFNRKQQQLLKKQG